jgi:hypothetical protein
MVPPQYLSFFGSLPLVCGNLPGKALTYWSTETNWPGSRYPLLNICSFSSTFICLIVSAPRRACLAIWHATHSGSGHDDALGCFTWIIGSSFPSGLSRGIAISHWIHWKPAWPNRQCQRNNSFCAAVMFWFTSAATDRYEDTLRDSARNSTLEYVSPTVVCSLVSINGMFDC